MPDNQLYPIVSNQEEDLYTALYDNKVDVIVHNKDMFMEHKYIHEHFNLDIINTIYDYPRQYRFYFNANKTNEKLVELFDRYLLVMDTSGAYSKYRIGEKKLIQAYINQKNKQLAFKLFAFFIVFVLLIVIFFYRKNLLMARELYEANQELQKLYGTDPLTRLPNRHKLNEVLRKEYARYSRSKSPLSVLFIDADFFKAINDNYGHNVGDKYLIKMAQTLKESMRHRSNFVARFGGEEFVCLLPNTNSEQAIQMAKYIQKKINELNLRNPLSSTKVQTVSIGIITLIKENINIDEIISHADEQLYKAKKAGRNTIRSAVI